MKTPITIAEQTLQGAREDADRAEAVHAKALVNKVEMDAIALDPAADLDKSAVAVAAAAQKIDIAAKRLALAKERVAVAEKAVQSASVDAVKVELASAEEKVAQVDADVMSVVRSSLATITEALADLHEKANARNALVSKLGQLGAPVPAAKSGPVLRSLVMHQPSDTAIRAAIRNGERFDGPTIDGGASLQAVLKYIAAEPARALEAKLNAEAGVRGREAQRHADALAGKLGEAERDAALAKVSAFYKRDGAPVDTSTSDEFAVGAISHRVLSGEA